MRKQLPHLGRRRIQPILLVAGVAASAALAMSMTGTLSAFVASITNNSNTAQSGTVILQETGIDSTGLPATCNSTDVSGVGVIPANTGLDTNAFTCGTINEYGGNTAMVPKVGGTTANNTAATTQTFKNTGTATASSFTLTPSACTQTPLNTALPAPATTPTSGSAKDFCTKLNVVISEGGVSLFTGTAASLFNTYGGMNAPLAITPVPLPGGAAVTITFTVSIDSLAGNSYQNLTASQPLVWTLTS